MHQTLTQEDFQNCRRIDDGESELNIRFPGSSAEDGDGLTKTSTSLSSSRGGKEIRSITLSSSCTICLSEYELGDEVVRSPNDRCSHVFHLDCILAWLSLPLRDGGSCPCCREPFAVVVVVDPPLKVAAAKAVRLRIGVGGGHWRRRISAARLP